MTKKMIIDAYCRIRTIDNTIPDDVLDFIKDAAIQEDKANYLIDEDPNIQGGTILPYELVEQRCLKADA